MGTTPLTLDTGFSVSQRLVKSWVVSSSAHLITCVARVLGSIIISTWEIYMRSLQSKNSAHRNGSKTDDRSFSVLILAADQFLELC